ncbi:MAG TPA: O-antigen ligase family protein [Noviherbaspirillum sp.]|uniref:O-antigen ligase family protein n=1 Tax=Noviherbaspirillum sp. TaxID=1926288 RepID=UPI002D6A040D|nr:O-antigen ligase family protein [Noviherbaspirillum sp.]HYD97618.1 O-antigen ligase family protein [Noviherbaspirillum sp.]
MTPALSPAEVTINVVGALFAIPIVFGIFIKAPKLVVFGFIGILFCFSDSTWGQLETDANIYSRGVGMFYFSLLNLILMVAGVAALLKRLANPQGPQLAPPMAKYLAAFVFLLLGHVVVGLMQGIELDVILGYSGIFNVLNMMVFMYLVIMAFESEKDTQRLLLMIIALATLRAIFGAVRFFLFDGDTANPYRNFEGLDIKIFYFDINDNFVASLGAFCAAWLLTTPGVKLGWFKRGLLIAFLVLEVAAVALSFRRTSLIGLGLMFLFLFLRLPGTRKFMFSIVAAGLLAAVASVFYEHRLQFASEDDMLSSLIYDIAPSRGIKDGRFYELYAAAQSMDGNWLFGRGTWGTFSGDRERLSYHGDDFSFVHSGFGHVLLKTGIVGLLLFCGLLAAYVGFYMRHRNSLAGYARLLGDAGFAGFLFWVPTLLVGTPIIEFRTMMMLGLVLAMPFIAVGIRNYQVRAYQYDPRYAVA